MSMFIGLITSLMCLVLPVAFVIALINWLVRCGRRAAPTRIDVLNAFNTLLARWEQAQ